MCQQYPYGAYLVTEWVECGGVEGWNVACITRRNMDCLRCQLPIEAKELTLEHASEHDCLQVALAEITKMRARIVELGDAGMEMFQEINQFNAKVTHDRVRRYTEKIAQLERDVTMYHAEILRLRKQKTQSGDGNIPAESLPPAPSTGA